MGDERTVVEDKKLPRYEMGAMFGELFFEQSYEEIEDFLASRSGDVCLEFSKTSWIDLLPSMGLCHLIQRHADAKRSIVVELPSPTAAAGSVPNRALSFMYDWGILAELQRLGCRLSLRGVEIREMTEKELRKTGYYPTTFKDRRIVPLSYVTDFRQVEQLASTITAELRSRFGPFAFDGGIRDGAVSESFLYELCSNVLEHATSPNLDTLAHGYVSLRVVRPISAIAMETRETVRRSRARESLSDLRWFYRHYPELGFVELIVSDGGRGIADSLVGAFLASAEFRKRSQTEAAFRKQTEWPRAVLRYALEPGSSRFSSEERQKQGKAPFTGLGTLNRALAELGGIIVIRERSYRVWFAPQLGKEGNVRFVPDRDRPGERRRRIPDIQGCNIKVMFPVRGERSPRKRHVLQPGAVAPPSGTRYQYANLISLDGDYPLDRSPNSVHLASMRADLDSLSQDEVLVLDSQHISTTKNQLFSPLMELCDQLKRIRVALVLANLSRGAASRINEMLSNENWLFRKGKSPKAGYDEVERPKLVALGVGPDHEPIWIGILSDDLKNALTESLYAGHAINSMTLRLMSNEYFVISGETVRVRLDEIGNVLSQGRHQALLERIIDSGAYRRKETRLPTDEVVPEYISPFSTLSDDKLWQELSYEIIRELSRFDFDCVITGTVAARAIWHKLSPVVEEWSIHHESHDFSSIERTWEPQGYPGQKPLMFMDAIHTGQRCQRILEWCLSLGMEVSGIVTVFDVSPTGLTSLDGIRVTSVIRYPIPVVKKKGTDVDLVVDPVCGFVAEKSRMGYPTSPFKHRLYTSFYERSYAYEMLRRQRLFEIGHFTNGQRHLEGAVLLPRLLRFHSAMRATVIRDLSDATKGSEILLYPEGSDIEWVIDGISHALGDNTQVFCIPRIIGPDGEYLYMLPTAYQDELKRCKSVAIIDDAACTGTSIVEMLALISGYDNIVKISCAVVVDYSSAPLRDAITVAVKSSGESRVSFSAMLRIDIPTHRGPETCPICERKRVLERYRDHAVVGLLQEYCGAIADELSARDIRYLDKPTVSPKSDKSDASHGDILGAAADAVSFLELAEEFSSPDGLAKGIEKYRITNDVLVSQRLARSLACKGPLLALADRDLELIQETIRKIEELPDGLKDRIITEVAFWPRELAAKAFPGIFESASRCITSGCVYLALTLLCKRLWESSGEHERAGIRSRIERAMADTTDLAREKKALLQSVRAELGILSWEGNDLSRHIHFLRTRLGSFEKEHHKLLRDGLVKIVHDIRDDPGDMSGAIRAIEGTTYALDLLSDVAKRVRFLIHANEIYETPELTAELSLIDECVKDWMVLARTSHRERAAFDNLGRKLQQVRDRLFEGWGFSDVRSYLERHIVPIKDILDQFQKDLRQAARDVRRTVMPDESLPVVQDRSMIPFLSHHLASNLRHSRDASTDCPPLVEIEWDGPERVMVCVRISVFGVLPNKDDLLRGASLGSMRRVMQGFGGDFRSLVDEARGCVEHQLKFERG